MDALALDGRILTVRDWSMATTRVEQLLHEAAKGSVSQRDMQAGLAEIHKHLKGQ